MSNFDHFNLIGPIYDKIFGRRKDHEIVELADVHPDHVLLDVGGGTGRVTALFKMITESVFIADSSAKMLYEAQDKGIPSVHSQSEMLPFETGVFDRIIMVDALHHVANQTQTLNEMWRVLASGGKIVIEEPDINHPFVKLIALAEKLLLMRSHFLSPKKIVKLCDFDGHAVVKTHKDKGNAWIIITETKPVL